MALGKVRTNKRSSSSSSCTSTMTLVAFVALCVLGVWMLTSDTVVPPQTTTRTDTTASTTSTATAAVIDTVLPSASTLEPRSDNKKKDTPSFDDTPGELPEDALGQGDGSTEKGRPRQDSDSQQTNPNESTEGAEERGTKEKNSVVEEDSHGLRGKESYEEREKQDVSETQVSEESTMTQSQQVEETTEEDPNANHPRNPETEKESGSENPRDAKGEEEEEEGTHARDQTHKLGAKERNKSGNDDSDGQLESAANRQNYEDFHLRRQVSKSGGEAQEHSTGPQTAQIIEEDHANKAQYGKNGDIGPDFPQDHTQRVEPDKSPIQEPKNEEKPGGESNSGGSFPGGGGDSSGIPKESKESQRSWVTQADQSETQKERSKDDGGSADESIYGYTWRLCNVTSGPDYIPCLDNTKAIRKLRSRRHFEHRERHCPEEGPTCLVPIPEGYKKSIKWPTSRDKIWYHNVPNTLLAEVKGHQNWVKVTGEFLTFPGGGTQFIHGALHYIDFLQSSVPKIAWGKNTRVVLDVGCGVASFGGFLFERDVLTMSFAPKDEHEAQVQFALERGIPAISAVMGSKRLPFPSRVFDLVHCARCRVPWHNEGGLLLLELNRVLRPGGYFVWSATPVYQKLEEDVEIWKAMTALTASMCWEVVAIKRDKINSIGAAIYRKPTSNECYNKRKHNRPPMCENDDDPNAAWYVPLQPCMHRVPEDKAERGTHWPMVWPKRLQAPPYWLNSSQMGIYGKPAPQDFATDYEHWKRVVKNMYLNGLGIDWSNIRNAMDMRAVYGGFAAAMKDFKIWILNVVNVNSPDTLPIIYERGLFGIYHDWCESFSTYPRSYDLLHADHLFSRLKKRCKLTPLMAEIDRILRPGGKLIVRDESAVVGEVENLLKSLHWEVHLTFSKNQEGILSAQKGEWRPEESEAASS